MSYEYKEKIKEDLEYSLEGVSIDYYSSEELIHKQKVKELDNVYAQATKADEYEVKAKAWDLLTEDINFIENEIEEIGLSQMLAVKTIGIKALKRKNEYESGEPNV